MLTLEKSPALSAVSSTMRVPEILAPAGGREQFFAALQSGADAVYLGLKQFNARGRAENFTLEDLRELAPLARRYQMKILVTLNILLKEAELPRLRLELAELQWIGIHAVIVQDLGVARFIRENFPTIRLHASTQLAVHNLSGVLAAIDFGFKRVVVARELTAQELRKIQSAVEDLDVEVEAFCHGSLCYSYSGLCFFSGAEDARSGNRGECAYTCRKPYKILNEPGHGFLFSMKDLNTSKDLLKLVDASIHTLKIEGRKKDAQYVATSVGLYRQELNRIFGRETGPQGRSVARNYEHDMSFSFHRDMTSLFVNGRYHENVIDLNNPTHKGLLIGTIEKIKGRTIEVMSTQALERFDGLRIESRDSVYHALPQHGDKVQAGMQRAQKKYKNDRMQFSLREFSLKGRRLNSSNAHTRVEIELPLDIDLPAVGDAVYKIRSNELKRHTEILSKAPADSRIRPLRSLDLGFVSEKIGEKEELSLKVTATLGTEVLLVDELVLPYQEARNAGGLLRDIQENFTILGDAEVDCTISFAGDENAFAPRSLLKELKQRLNQNLPKAISDASLKSLEKSQAHLKINREALAPAISESYAIKIDRLEYLVALESFLENHRSFPLGEVVFEPKRAFLGKLAPEEIFDPLFTFVQKHGVKLRFAFPTVLRAWDEPLLKVWVNAFLEMGGNAFEIGNIGARTLLAGFATDRELDLSSDFTLYCLNTEAALAAGDLGISTLALSIEDDRTSLRDKMEHWPKRNLKPQAILYKDTPLFIAEACSLTALHKGCPTAAVCGYRTLEIENDEGERFFVAHESCKSIVYGAKAFSLSEFRSEFKAMGIGEFRIDFLTREYSFADFQAVLEGIHAEKKLPETHSANYERLLL